MSGLLQVNGGPDEASEGFVDLLGDMDPTSTVRGRGMFRNRVMPVVYERLWRPLITRPFYGMFGPWTAAERRIVLGMLDISSGEKVLDVGCGTGIYTRHFARAADGGLVVGLDATIPMLVAAARKRANSKLNLAYARADACSLPFGDAEFDAVCCTGVLHILERPMTALDEIVRVLAPGGRVAIMATCRKKEGEPRRRGPLEIFDRDELTGHLEEQGLGEIQQRVFSRAQFVGASKPR